MNRWMWSASLGCGALLGLAAPSLIGLGPQRGQAKVVEIPLSYDAQPVVDTARAPVSDTLRSVMRSVREELALTSQHLRALGLTGAQVQGVLAEIRAAVEPRLADIESARDAYYDTRFRLLSTESGQLLQTAALVGPPANEDEALRQEFAAELAERQAELPAMRSAYDDARRSFLAPLESLEARVAGLLTDEQRLQWRACRANQSDGLPMPAWFVASLSAAQRSALRTGAAWQAVLDASQQKIAETAMQRYGQMRQVVQEAENAFYFASSPTAAASESKSQTAQPAACPFSRG